MPKYKITSGTFRDSDDTIKGPGDTIELGEDVAKTYASQLKELPAEPAAAVDQAAHVDPAQ